MLSYKKSAVEKYFDPLVILLKGVNPNVITLLGSIPPLLFFVFVFFHWYAWAIIAFCFNFLDFLDGMVARKYHKVTKFGGFLDSTLDRLADFLMIACFGFANIVRFEIIVPILLFTFLTSYIRARGELANPNVSFAMGLIERTERLFLIIFALIFYLLFPNLFFFNFNAAEQIFIVLLILSLFTVFQRMIFAYKKL
ncbi:MAG TPA: CDP-alcohol phosphatidyltransferase family protein [Patescibacteria group bacterium]